jgi:hypothetical protein
MKTMPLLAAGVPSGSSVTYRIRSAAAALIDVHGAPSLSDLMSVPGVDGSGVGGS